MSARERLSLVLQEAEEKASRFELDQIAWCVARMCLFRPHERAEFTKDRPRLTALVDEILQDELDRRRISSWDHLLAEVGEKRLLLSEPMALLELSDWRDREDRLGNVADLLIRVFCP